MNLSDEEVLSRIQSPRNANNIELAKNQEERLLMHCESILEKYSLPFWAYRNFTLWWQSLITKEKHNKVDQLISTPLHTTSLTEEIFKQIGKFRDAQDRYISFEFTVKDYTNDYEEYLQSINDDTFWRDNCLEALKTGICDICVVDLPSIQKSNRPEPYQYLVSPHFFVDVEKNKFNGKLEYFIFKQSNFKWDSALNEQAIPARFDYLQVNTELERIIAVDDTYYRLIIRDKSAVSEENRSWQIMSKVAHNLGYTPCIDFWEPYIKGTNGINKKGILTNLLSKLDKYLFYSALVDYLDIYGAFPIFVTYAMEDETWDDKRKDVNFGDYYSPSTSSYISGDKGTSKDPRTTYSWVGGAGTILEYPQPKDSQDANFVKDAPHFINMPVDALKHVNDRCKGLKNEILEYATGQDSEYMNEVAKTPEMFDASFNKQDSILTFTKRQVERVHRFVTKARAELRYGKEYFISCTVDYGSDYFLKDANKIVEEFKAAVEAGMHPEYTAQIAKEAYLTRFKNNPDMLERQRIMRDIIPYAGMSLEDMILAGINLSDTDNFVIRINTDTFVNQFELEFGDIVKFGKNLTYSDKIANIKNQLQRYGKEINWKPVVPKPTGLPVNS